MTARPENPAEDPVVQSGRREAIFTLGLWAVAAVYTVSYCTLHGYGRDPQDLRFVLWFPDWVFWGIVAPWLICASVSIWFALCVMQDAPLISGSDTLPDDNGPDDNVSDDNGPDIRSPSVNSPRPGPPAPGGRP